MSAKNDLMKLCERFEDLQSDFWYNNKYGIDELSDSEIGDLQEFLSLRNAGFPEEEIRDMVGEEQFSVVQAIIARIRDNAHYAKPKKARKKRRVAICDMEAVDEPEEY